MLENPVNLETVRSQAISRVLLYYFEKFTVHLAITISVTKKLPEEINNHIRNAFTHVSRIQIAASTDQIKEESAAAIKHIERANRDCLKASIMQTRETLENLILDVKFFRGSLSPTLDAQYNDLKRLRKEAYITESRGDNHQTSKLEIIYRKHR
ncbi:MAG: hypothetical protein HQL95_13985 [Magnetococcales bacterium]|nr:hypothetical protein [Magnetococcales bacterium]